MPRRYYRVEPPLSTVAGGVARGGGWMNRSPWRLEEVDGSPWMLEEVDGGDEQYPVESRFAVRHTPPDEQDPCFDRSAPTQVRFLCFAVCHTRPDEHDPRFDRRRSVSSVCGKSDPSR